MIETKNGDTQSVCYDVLISMRRIIQAVDLHSKYLLRNYGLTGPQLVILQELSKSEAISIGELAKIVSIGQATVTGILNRLEQRKLITRRRSRKDKRKIFVKATKGGKAIIRKAPPPIQITFMDHFSNLLDWEQNMIVSALQRIVSMMDASEISAVPVLATDLLSNAETRLVGSVD